MGALLVVALGGLASPTPAPANQIFSPAGTTCAAGTAVPCRYATAADPTPLPAPTPVPAPFPDAGGAGAGCGLTDIGACFDEVITGFFRGVISDALNPLLGLLSDTLLTTPTPDSLPAVGALWAGSWQIVLTGYGLLVLIAGILLMAHETVQSRHSAKEIAPRLVVGFLAGAVSLLLAEKAVELANSVSAAVLGDGLDPVTAGDTLRNLVLASLNHNFFLIFVAVFLVGMICALLLGYVIRVMLTIILIAGAPLALMFHALPQTEGVAYWWWRAFGGCLAIQIVQSLTLITALKVFLAPSGFTLFGPTDNGLVGLLVALALMWVLYRVPFWILAAVRRGGSRRSLVGSLIRSYIAYRTFGLLTGRGRGGPGGRPGAGPPPGGPAGPSPGGGGAGGGGRRRSPGGGGPPPGGRRRPGPPPGGASRPAGGPADPYARVRVTRSGQYVLPLPGVRRSGARPPAPATAAPARPAAAPAAGRGRQLALPLGEDWPEQRPRAGRDGQYRLPIAVPRVPARRAPSPPTLTPGPRPGAGGRPRAGTQLKLPFDPYRGVRADRSGQYPLPLEDLPPRRPRTAASTPATPRPPSPRPSTPVAAGTPVAAAGTPRPSPARTAGRQLRLPLDLPRPTRPTPPPPPDRPPPPLPPPPASPPRLRSPRRRSS
jgi:hypothetical protein